MLGAPNYILSDWRVWIVSRMVKFTFYWRQLKNNKCPSFALTLDCVDFNSYRQHNDETKPFEISNIEETVQCIQFYCSLRRICNRICRSHTSEFNLTESAFDINRYFWIEREHPTHLKKYHSSLCQLKWYKFINIRIIVFGNEKHKIKNKHWPNSPLIFHCHRHPLQLC